VENRVLIIGYVWVEPNSSAAGSRMLQLIHAFLENNYVVTFASPAQKSEKAIDLTAIGVTEVAITLNASSFDDFVSQLHPKIVIFDRFMMEEQFGWRVAEHCPNALRILDTEDLHFLRKTRHDFLKKNLNFTTEVLLDSEGAKREIASILKCDITLVISLYEMSLLKNTFQIKEQLLHHLPFLLPKIEVETKVHWKSFKEREHFIFVGNFLHAPNVDAVVQLKKYLWKRIRNKIPTAELHIYGAYLTQQIQEFHNPKEGFFIKGYREDIKTVVEQARVVLAPLRFGAGIKGKLTEAMVCGTPSITTEIGAEGMHGELSWNGFIAQTEQDFVNKSVCLYTKEILWKKMQNNGITLINTLYNKVSLQKSFIQRIQYLIEHLGEHRRHNFLGGLLHYKTAQATKYMSKWIEAKNS
jgi:glycosyltransferase involved in cell wall biosynthesis